LNELVTQLGRHNSSVLDYAVEMQRLGRELVTIILVEMFRLSKKVKMTYNLGRREYIAT